VTTKSRIVHNVTMWVHDYDPQGDGSAVWAAKNLSDVRYFEASIDEEAWALVDLAVHCYE
jgi:hypothetical protein